MNTWVTSQVLLVSVSAGVVWDLAAHVPACYLYFEERSIRTHTELVAHPVTSSKLVSTGGTR